MTFLWEEYFFQCKEFGIFCFFVFSQISVEFTTYWFHWLLFLVVFHLIIKGFVSSHYFYFWAGWTVCFRMVLFSTSFSIYTGWHKTLNMTNGGSLQLMWWLTLFFNWEICVFTCVLFLEQYFSTHRLLPISGRQNSFSALWSAEKEKECLE